MRRRLVLALAAVAAIGLGAWALARLARAPAEPLPRLSVAAALTAPPAAGFARAEGPPPPGFPGPGDHRPHPAYRTEWWYFTGNLQGGVDGEPDAADRRLGYQLTFFRNALAPPGATTGRSSAWAADQAWLAHFAVSDGAGGFHSFERWGRGALGLAGAETAPFSLWLGDWSAAAAPAAGPPGPAGLFPLRLAAADGEVAVDLVLSAAKPPVAQGEGGWSRKGSQPGNASYYYSYTRLDTRGTVTLGGRPLAVAGSSWLDREWSTSALEAGQNGWDWFSLQLDDGRDLMYYRIRRDDGSADRHSEGSLVGPDGERRPLPAAAVELTPRGWWTSPRSGARYPVRWSLRIPTAGLDLVVEPLLDDQELDVSFVYWEGAVRVAGTSRGAPIAGVGYLEMTGYAGTAPAAVQTPRAGPS